MNSIDLIRQYVDTGLELPNYQIKKLTPNLLKTYLRKRLVAVDANDYKWLSNFEIDLLDKDSQLIYFSKITPIQLNAYLKSSKTTTYESFLERWDKVVDFISYQLDRGDYFQAVGESLGHSVNGDSDKFDSFVVEHLLAHIEDSLGEKPAMRKVIFSQLLLSYPKNDNTNIMNIINILLSKCPLIDNMTLNRISPFIKDKEELLKIMTTKYIPSFIRKHLSNNNTKDIIYDMLLKLPPDLALRARDELYKYIPKSYQDLLDYLSQLSRDDF